MFTFSFIKLTCKMLPGGKVRYRFLRDKAPVLTGESPADVGLTAVHSVTSNMKIRTKASSFLSPILFLFRTKRLQWLKMDHVYVCLHLRDIGESKTKCPPQQKYYYVYGHCNKSYKSGHLSQYRDDFRG